MTEKLFTGTLNNNRNKKKSLRGVNTLLRFRILAFLKMIDSVMVFLYSDATLNPSGIRFGSADIYRIGELQDICRH